LDNIFAETQYSKNSDHSVEGGGLNPLNPVWVLHRSIACAHRLWPATRQPYAAMVWSPPP